MQIGGISASTAFGVTGLPDTLSTTSNPGETTGNSFAQMLDALSGASAEADAATTDLAVGGERDLHDVVLAVEMESLSFDLAVQIRNRLVEAYSEIFRMQV